MEQNSSANAIRLKLRISGMLNRLAGFPADERVIRAAISIFLIVQLTFITAQAIPPKFFLVRALGGGYPATAPPGN